MHNDPHIRWPLMRSLPVQIEHSRGEPVFAQIRDQIAALIEAGELKPRMRLPPVRALAREHGVNHMTVARAYKELVDRGLLEGRHGAGTYVRAGFGNSGLESEQGSPGPRPSLLSQRLYELGAAPGVIALTANYPSPPDMCLQELRRCVAAAMDAGLEPCLRYDPPEGRISLREAIVEMLGRESFVVDVDDIVVTSGAQQGIDLIIRALVRPGMQVIVERPAYYGAINAIREAGGGIMEVPLGDDGIDLNELSAIVKKYSVSLVYTNPTFQNPTGVTMTEEKRHALLALARQHDLLILEDDHQPELRYRGRPVPALRALAGSEDRVFYVRSFGKSVVPGLRMGFVVAPSLLRNRLLAIKATADLHCNSVMQEALARFLRSPTYESLINHHVRRYSDHQRMVVDGLFRGMPYGTQVGSPDGGLSIWLTLPHGVNVSNIYFRAVERGVAFVAGEVFYASRPDWSSLRISFGLNEASELKEGISRLCSVIHDVIKPRRNTPQPFI